MENGMNLMDTMGVTDSVDKPVEGDVEVTTETTVVSDPATAVTAETTTTPAAGNFLAAHKGTIIKGGIALVTTVAAGFVVRKVLKKHAEKKAATMVPEFDDEIEQNLNEVQGTAPTQEQQVTPEPTLETQAESKTPPVITVTEHMETARMTISKPTDEVLAEARVFRDHMVKLPDADSVLSAWQDAAKTARVTGTFLGVPVRGYPNVPNISFDRTLNLMQQVHLAMNYWLNGGNEMSVDIECSVKVKSEEDGTETRIAMGAIAHIPDIVLPTK